MANNTGLNSHHTVRKWVLWLLPSGSAAVAVFATIFSMGKFTGKTTASMDSFREYKMRVEKRIEKNEKEIENVNSRLLELKDALYTVEAKVGVNKAILVRIEQKLDNK